MPRSRLGPLALESKLGDHPSRSIVWRAIHVDLRRAVAVKVFALPFGGTPEARESFAEEWETLKRLQHAAIARCYGGGFEETDAYLAYELIEGPTLAQELERRSRLPWDEVLDLSIPLAEALAVAHRAGLPHGALYPSKIILSGLSPVILDFRVDRGHSQYRNPLSTPVHELALQPPEMLQDPTAITPAGDLYTLGATLFYALTGRPPIEGETASEVQRHAAVVMPPKAAALALDCPVWLSAIIEQCLAKSPQDRPHDAKALALSLTEAKRLSFGFTGVAEQASSGFSPLQVTKQKEKDEARALLGREVVDWNQPASEPSSFMEQSWVLVAALIGIVGFIGWLVWPLSEAQMKSRAEVLIAEATRSSLDQAKNSYLLPMTKRFPEGEYTQWALDEIDRIEMLEAEKALEVKINRNLPLRDEGERLYAEALRFERFGDSATALDRYRSLKTLLSGQPQYKPFVMLADRQIQSIRSRTAEVGEAARIVQTKLNEADQLQRRGNVIAARDIWYSIIELYANNADVAPLVEQAQQRLGSAASTTTSPPATSQ